MPFMEKQTKQKKKNKQNNHLVAPQNVRLIPRKDFKKRYKIERQNNRFFLERQSAAATTFGPLKSVLRVPLKKTLFVEKYPAVFLAPLWPVRRF